MATTGMLSILNPLATTFVPSLPFSSKTALTRTMAQKLMQEVIESKKDRREKTLTKQELVDLVEKLIIIRYNINRKVEMSNIKAYLNAKIPNVIGLKSPEGGEISKSNPSVKECNFNLSAVPPPKPFALLIAFWGLYRHEQAVRPMLSLTTRPEMFTDPVWSLKSEDLKIWNSSCTQSCSCPPMFGYSVPPDFFGNPFKLVYSCPVKSIHLARSRESVDGNELILMDSMPKTTAFVEPFTDDNSEEKVQVEMNLDFYSEQLKSIVAGVCNLIADEDPGIQKADPSTKKNESFESRSHLLWNSNSSKDRMTYQMENNDFHPLLETDFSDTDEGVPQEIEEMILQSLSPENGKTDPDFATFEEKLNSCDPPCSVWCHTKVHSPDSVVSTSSTSSSVISLLNDTSDFLMSSSEIGLSNTNDLKYDRRKRNFRRSFSANDCDLSNDEKYIQVFKAPQPSTAKESLAFSKKDSSLFPKPRNGGIWRDSDSGIISQWSSDEDVDEMTEDRNHMWSLFNGEGSLWKPLPEHSNTKQHKRVRDLKRQSSLN